MGYDSFNNSNIVSSENYKKKGALFYLSSALLARTVTTSLTFPLEYMRTVKFAETKNNSS